MEKLPQTSIREIHGMPSCPKTADNLRTSQLLDELTGQSNQKNSGQTDIIVRDEGNKTNQKNI